MGQPNKKKLLVDKIAKEQNLDVKDLNRLPIEELKKMDLVVPDDGGDLLGADAPESPSSDDSSEQPVSKPGKGKYIGNNPVTGLPVYDDTH